MTIHKSKGLEFENVIYIPFDLESGLPEKTQEDENLDYIAKTRAKKCLFIMNLWLWLWLPDY